MTTSRNLAARAALMLVGAIFGWAATASAAQPGPVAQDPVSSEAEARRAVAAAGDALEPLYEARVALGRALHAQRRYNEAATEFAAAARIAQQAVGSDHQSFLMATVLDGNARLAAGRFDQAEPLYLRALEISGRIHGADHPQTVGLQNDVAMIYAGQRRSDDALRLLALARAGAERMADGEELLARTINNLVGVYTDSGRNAEAEALLRETLEREARAGPDDVDTIQTASNLATLYLNSGRLAEAEALASGLLPRAERMLGADHETTLHVLTLASQLKAAQGRYTEAEPLLRRLYDTRRRGLGGEGGQPAIEAANLLARALNDAGRYAEAETIYRRAADVSQRSLGADHWLTLTTRTGVGLALMLQGKLTEAEQIQRAIVEGFERADAADSLEGLQALANLSTTYQRLGRFAEAEPLLLRAVERGGRSLGPAHPSQLLFLSNLAELFGRQGRVEDAIPIAIRALEGADSTFGPDSPRALLYAHNLGIFMRSVGRQEEAEALIARALAGRERIFGFDNRETQVTAGAAVAIHADRGRMDEAVALARRIVAASERTLGPDHLDTIEARLLLANLFMRMRRVAEAAPIFERVASDAARRLPAGDERLIDAASGLALGRQVMRLVHGDRSVDTLAPARLAVEAIRARRSDRGGRFGAAQAARELTSRGEVFMLLADALWDRRPGQAETGEAFAALQEAVAGTTDRAVMQMAVRRFADERGAGLGALVREREELESQWNATAQRQVDLLTAPNVTADERAAVRADSARIEARMDAVDAELRRGFPDFFELANPGAIPLDRAASVLQPDEVLLMIVPGNRGTHLMSVTKQGLTWRVSALTRAQVDNAVRRLLWQLGGNVAPTAAEQSSWAAEPADAFDRATAHRLYTELVAPMAEQLRGRRHVYVAAAGSLASLPLGVLVVEPPTGSDSDPAALRTTRWLADAHALIQVPSVQSMLMLRRFGGVGPSGTRFVGFGDPLLEGRAERRGAVRGGRALPAIFRSGASIADVSALKSMARLPGTAEELRNMRAALAAPANSIFLGAQATEAQLRGMDLSDVRILALATHGIMAGEVDGAGEPGLVLTPPAEPSDRDDGYLAASEIAALRLNADWVILSACNTAAGDGTDGAQGLSGLARAFFYAGARTLLASHWPVRDDVGAVLTVRAVQLQRSDPSLSRAEAFQRAMREVREDANHDWAHPNAWAPFTLIGDAAR